MSAQTYLVGVYDDDDVLMDAVKHFRKQEIKVKDVFTPFPIHGLEYALGYKESRLPTVAFICGITGTSLALIMQTFMYFVDWAVNIGGKPRIPLPAFIPITFEMTVLLASFGMVFAYLIVNKMYPGQTPTLFDPRQTDDLFIMVVEKSEIEEDNAAVREAFNKTKAIEVREQTLTAKETSQLALAE